MFQISLKAARVNAGLSGTEAAKKIGVTFPTLYNWESGKTTPTIMQLKKLCELYSCPMDIIKL